MSDALEPRSGSPGALVEALAEGGGFVFADPLPGPRPSFAFVTLVQLDGDVCLSINARALTLPDLDARLANHLARVHATLHARLARTRALIRHGGLALGMTLGLGLALYETLAEPDALSPWTQWFIEILGEQAAMQLSVAVAGALALLMSSLTRVAIRWALRRAHKLPRAMTAMSDLG